MDEEQGYKGFHDDAIPEDSFIEARSRIACGRDSLFLAQPPVSRARQPECEQLPNGQFGKTGCGNGTGTALTGDWPAGELCPTETRARRRSWSHRVSKTVAPQQIVTMLTGAPSNHAHTVVTTHPGANPLALPGTSSRNQADKRHQHQTDHIHTHTHAMPHGQANTQKHTHTLVHMQS